VELERGDSLVPNVRSGGEGEGLDIVHTRTTRMRAVSVNRRVGIALGPTGGLDHLRMSGAGLNFGTSVLAVGTAPHLRQGLLNVGLLNQLPEENVASPILFEGVGAKNTSARQSKVVKRWSSYALW
jgi:hypothetical protein